MQVQRQCFHCATGFTCFWGRHKFNALLEAPVTPLSIWHTGVSNKYKHKIKCYENQVKRMSKLETILRSPRQIAGQLLLGTNHLYPPPIFFFLKIQWGTMDNRDRYMMQHTEWVLQPLCSVIAAFFFPKGGWPWQWQPSLQFSEWEPKPHRLISHFFCSRFHWTESMWSLLHTGAWKEVF